MLEHSLFRTGYAAGCLLRQDDNCDSGDDVLMMTKKMTMTMTDDDGDVNDNDDDGDDDGEALCFIDHDDHDDNFNYLIMIIISWSSTWAQQENAKGQRFGRVLFSFGDVLSVVSSSSLSFSIRSSSPC